MGCSLKAGRLLQIPTSLLFHGRWCEPQPSPTLQWSKQGIWAQGCPLQRECLGHELEEGTGILPF